MLKTIILLIGLLLYSTQAISNEVDEIIRNKNYPEGFDTNKPAEVLREQIALALNGEREAGGTSVEEIFNKFKVTFNRVASGKFRRTVEDTVYQKDYINGKWSCQFSWTCDGVSDYPKSQKVWFINLLRAEYAFNQIGTFGKIGLYPNELADNVYFFHDTSISKPVSWKKLVQVAHTKYFVYYKNKS